MSSRFPLGLGYCYFSLIKPCSFLTRAVRRRCAMSSSSDVAHNGEKDWFSRARVMKRFILISAWHYGVLGKHAWFSQTA
jgi:hypothetical protein